MDKSRVKELYKVCKDELTIRRENTRYFTLKFFEDYIEFERLRMLSEKDEKYRELKQKHLEEHIFNSDIYNKNGGCYCEFLCVAYKFRNRVERLIGVTGV